MPKLYFKYGCMGSSKTANALMVKYNYEQKGFKVLLLKPSIDTRDGSNIMKSRIGLESECLSIDNQFDIINYYGFYYEVINVRQPDVIIIDESQFLTTKQVEQLYYIAHEIPVLCYGLLTDFQTNLFEGSKRLIELSESITEIKTICKCGKKATINARIDSNGNIIKNGESILIGGDEKYISVCKYCYGDL